MSAPVQQSEVGTSTGGQLRRSRVLYGAAAFLFWVSLYLYLPTLPVYTESKADNLALVGVALSMYGLWQALVRIPIGIAADSIGRRKPFLIAGFALAGAGAWIMGAADGIAPLIIGRAVTGLAAGTWVAFVVIFAALFPPDTVVRVTALVSLISSLSRVAATALTGPLNDWGGYSLPFFLATLTAALAILVVAPAHEERHKARRPRAHEIRHLLGRRDVLLPSVLAGVLQYAVWTTSYGFNPLLAEELGGSNVFIGLLVTANLLMLATGNFTAMTLANRISNRQILAAGFVLLAASVVGAALAPTRTWLLVAQLGLGLGQGLAYPTLMGLSIRYVDDVRRTIAMGLHQSVYAVGMFAGPWISGLLADAIGIRPTYVITAVGCLGLGLFGLRYLVGRQERVMSNE